MTEKNEIEVVPHHDPVKVCYDFNSVSIEQEGGTWRESQSVYLTGKQNVQRLIAALTDAVEKME